MPRSAAAIAIFCSGQGTNFQAIVDSIKRRHLKARVTVMVTDNPQAFAIVRARRARIPVVVVDPKRFTSRQKFDQALARAVDRFRAKAIVLAGFMRILTPWFVRRYPGRIVNVHPAKLPAFPGAHAIRDVLKAKIRKTGVTIHFVDEQVDHGPIILQEEVKIHPRDTQATLGLRIHRLEHRLYPKAISLVLSGQVQMPSFPKKRKS